MTNRRVQSVRNGLRTFNRWAGVLNPDPYGLGLSLSQCGALVDLERFGSLRPAALASLLKLDRSTVSRLISVLLDKRFIAVSESAEDKRGKVISLTQKGQKALAEIHRISNESITSAFRFLDNKDQEEVSRAFDKLSHAVTQAEDEKQRSKP